MQLWTNWNADEHCGRENPPTAVPPDPELCLPQLRHMPPWRQRLAESLTEKRKKQRGLNLATLLLYFRSENCLSAERPLSEFQSDPVTAQTNEAGMETTMQTLMKNSVIPLPHAVLCVGCNCVSAANRECPACSSKVLMNLSPELNRKKMLWYSLDRSAA